MKIQNVNFIWTRTEFGILYFYSFTVDFTLAVSKTHQLFQRKYKIWGFLWGGCVERNPLCRIHWLMYRNLNKTLCLHFGLNPCLLSLSYKEIEICEWKIPHKSLLAIGLPVENQFLMCLWIAGLLLVQQCSYTRKLGCTCTIPGHSTPSF